MNCRSSRSACRGLGGKAPLWSGLYPDPILGSEAACTRPNSCRSSAKAAPIASNANASPVVAWQHQDDSRRKQLKDQPSLDPIMTMAMPPAAAIPPFRRPKRGATSTFRALLGSLPRLRPPVCALYRLRPQPLHGAGSRREGRPVERVCSVGRRASARRHSLSLHRAPQVSHDNIVRRHGIGTATADSGGKSRFRAGPGAGAGWSRWWVGGVS